MHQSCLLKRSSISLQAAFELNHCDLGVTMKYHRLNLYSRMLECSPYADFEQYLY
jgi:hypothetical protein